MKMTKEDYQNLKDAIVCVSQGYAPTYPFSVTQRWELFHAVNPAPSFPFRHLSEYLNDDHIDTALRKIVREIG